MAACEYIPSLHWAMASVGSLSSPRLVAVLVALGALDLALEFVRAGEFAGTEAGRLGAVVAVALPLMPP